MDNVNFSLMLTELIKDVKILYSHIHSSYFFFILEKTLMLDNSPDAI